MSPTLAVVDSTVVRVSRSQKFTQRKRKAPTVNSLFNRGTSIVFPKVYVRSTERFASMVSRVESAEEKEERLIRRRERNRLVIPASLDG